MRGSPRQAAARRSAHAALHPHGLLRARDRGELLLLPDLRLVLPPAAARARARGHGADDRARDGDERPRGPGECARRGALLDRFGRRIFLLGGIATMSAAAGAFLLVDRIGPAIFALRALQGLAFAAGFNAASTLAAEFAPEGRRAAALGLFGVSTLATHALAPTLGEQLVRLGGFPALFVAASVFSAVGLAVAWPLPDDAPARFHAALPLRTTAELSTAIATVACCGVAFGAVITYVPTFVQDAALGSVATFFLSYT
ncbi:MAG: MFS transporter, partial [Deltaproteobacteria bacterium]